MSEAGQDKIENNLKNLIDLKDITLSISEFLSAKEKLEEDDILIIEENYRKRKIILKNWMEFLETEEGNAFILKNPKKWNDFIEEILKIEKENLEILDKHLDTLGNRLKELTKQKSLLLYTKE